MRSCRCRCLDAAAADSGVGGMPSEPPVWGDWGLAAGRPGRRNSGLSAVEVTAGLSGISVAVGLSGVGVTAWLSGVGVTVGLRYAGFTAGVVSAEFLEVRILARRMLDELV